MTSEELYEKLLDAENVCEGFQEEMDKIFEAIENREGAKERALEEVVHDIKVARGRADKVWREYSRALNKEANARKKALAEE